MHVVRRLAPDHLPQRTHQRLGRIAHDPARFNDRRDVEAFDPARLGDRPRQVRRNHPG